MAMAVVELRAFLALLEGLGPDDWARPTACTLWDVHDVVAHVAGAAASYAERAEFARQWNPVAQRRVRLPGFSVLDALNQVQVADRAEAAPDLLIAELRKVGPRAIATRRRIPAPLRAIRLPMPALGVASVGYLTDLIYTRDMWIHRLDISRATGRAMELNPVHDSRMVALMARDLDRGLPDRHGARAVALELTGPAGGHFRLGADEPLRADLAIDALDFAWLAAGRIRPDDALNVCVARGDSMLIRLLLENAAVPV